MGYLGESISAADLGKVVLPPTARIGRPAPKSAEHNIPMSNNFRDTLETFENSFPDRDYVIEITCPEFTSVCPKTGQPDFGVLTFEYVPDQVCVELKSLKMYLQGFRNEGIFYEKVTNMILDDFVAVSKPRRALLTAKFTPRGGISSIIKCDYVAEA